jgi:hypothetical protein
VTSVGVDRWCYILVPAEERAGRHPKTTSIRTSGVNCFPSGRLPISVLIERES